MHRSNQFGDLGGHGRTLSGSGEMIMMDMLSKVSRPMRLGMPYYTHGAKTEFFDGDGLHNIRNTRKLI